MKRVFKAELRGWTAGLNSVRSDIFIETPATIRPSPVGAASLGRTKNMSPLRGLRFVVCDLAINMSLLTELGFSQKMEHKGGTL